MSPSLKSLSHVHCTFAADQERKVLGDNKYKKNLKLNIIDLTNLKSLDHDV